MLVLETVVAKHTMFLHLSLSWAVVVASVGGVARINEVGGFLSKEA